MKGKLALCFALLAAAAFSPLHVSAAAPQVSAKAAVLVNADDGSVLYAKNEHEHLAIASTTKIMTSLLALEAASADDKTVTITPEMIRVEGSSMYLHAGDRLTLRDLAAGMLAVSGNDAANAAAIAVSGTTDRFADRMNEKAAMLGMKDTHFVTPSGLDDAEHYSSASDMAVLARAALQNDDFAAIVRQKSLKVHFLNPDETRSYINHNKLLSLYPCCTGIKTGFTSKAGRCLVSSAEKDGVRLIAVTLSDPNDWNDHEELLDYGFSRLRSLPIDDSGFQAEANVVGGVRASVAVTGTKGVDAVVGADAKLQRTVELPRFVYAPVRAGEVLGSVRYDCDGKTVARTDIIAVRDVGCAVMPKNWFQVFWSGLLSLLSG